MVVREDSTTLPVEMVLPRHLPGAAAAVVVAAAGLAACRDLVLAHSETAAMAASTGTSLRLEATLA